MIHETQALLESEIEESGCAVTTCIVEKGKNNKIPWGDY